MIVISVCDFIRNVKETCKAMCKIAAQWKWTLLLANFISWLERAFHSNSATIKYMHATAATGSEY